MAAKPLTSLEVNGLRSALSEFYNSDNETELTHIFTIFDRNHDGKISRNELTLVMRSVERGMSEASIAQMMDEADVNGDGFIDLREFCEIMKRNKGA